MSNRRFIASVIATAAATEVVMPWARRRMACLDQSAGVIALNGPTALRRAA